MRPAAYPTAPCRADKSSSRLDLARHWPETQSPDDNSRHARAQWAKRGRIDLQDGRWLTRTPPRPNLRIAPRTRRSSCARCRSLPRILYDAYWRFVDDDGWAIASHIALSALMSLFPFLIFVTSLAGFVRTAATSPTRPRTCILDAWPSQVSRTARARDPQRDEQCPRRHPDRRRGAGDLLLVQRRREPADRLNRAYGLKEHRALVAHAARIHRAMCWSAAIAAAVAGVPGRARARSSGGPRPTMCRARSPIPVP